MNFFTTPSSERVHIAFFGKRNCGKSSIINAITNQETSIVSDTPGTTTDPVSKTMEILPLGPVVLTDTPGYDDIGELGMLRVKKAKKTLQKTDIAVLVADINKGIDEIDQKYINLFCEKQIPYVIALNKCDISAQNVSVCENTIAVSAKENINIYELVQYIAKLKSNLNCDRTLLGDLINKDDIIVLVTPIDSGAPKGRIILPQQQTIRDILDSYAITVAVQDTQLNAALKILKKPPALVVTDSQAFPTVNSIVPSEVPLTSFSILMARYKGFLDTAVQGAYTIDSLKDGDKILICEGCTHHKKCDDIGSVKLPAWIKEYTKKDLCIENISGNDFPEDLSKYKLVIHCGGCMLTGREMQSRENTVASQKIPMTNYGTAIAHMNGILKRSVQIFNL